MTTHPTVITALVSLADKEKAHFLKRFFKTDKGEYAEGDIFLGLTVPQTRKIAKQFKDLPFEEIGRLLQSEFHEARLCGLFILIKQYEKNPPKAYALYLKNLRGINNWDLVDTSAGYIVGNYLYHHQQKNIDTLITLAQSENLWKKRVAIIATFYFIMQKSPSETLKIAEILLQDQHDLIHKAVGWMLREVGKRCSQEIEETFLQKHANHMPRTMLRYAIERFPEAKRKWYLNIERIKN